MGFLIQCDNKGCGQLQSAYIDKDTDEVHCSICDGAITNVSVFIKRQMRSMNAWRPKEKHTFAVKCAPCKKEVQPKLVDGNIVCGKCGEELTGLTPFFVSMLKEKLKGSKE